MAHLIQAQAGRLQTFAHPNASAGPWMPARVSDMGDIELVILASAASILISSGVLRTAGLGVAVARSIVLAARSTHSWS